MLKGVRSARIDSLPEVLVLGEDGYSNPFPTKQSVCKKEGNVLLAPEEWGGRSEDDPVGSGKATEYEEGWGAWKLYEQLKVERMRTERRDEDANLYAKGAT